MSTNCSIIDTMMGVPMLLPVLSAFAAGCCARCGGLCLLLLGLLTASPWVAALPVSGLYSQRIAVTNESDAERERAFGDALAAVIVKVTGERRWLEHPVVRRALRNAHSYVEAIAYASESVPLSPMQPAGAPSAGTREQRLAAAADRSSPASSMIQRYIEVDFAAQLINQLLTDANIPVWDSNRPSVLVWMALQDVAGNRSLLTADINQDIIDTMRSFAEQRGLPILFPVLDFEDRNNLSEDLVWALDEAAIRRASARYDADSVLSGRLHFTASGELVGLWQFVFGERVEVFDGIASELEAYLHAPLDRITARLASYFAIVPHLVDSRTVRLRVEGVSDLRDYAAVLAYLENLGLVNSVLPAVLDGDRLELQLGVMGDAEQLFELIALDRGLQPLPGTQPDNQSLLHYRWTR